MTTMVERMAHEMAASRVRRERRADRYPTAEQEIAALAHELMPDVSFMLSQVANFTTVSMRLAYYEAQAQPHCEAALRWRAMIETARREFEQHSRHHLNK